VQSGLTASIYMIPMDTAREACHAEQAPVRNQRGNWGTGARCRRPRHRSEQYFTSSQTVFHFFRHWNGRPQTTQTFVGRLA